MWRLVFAFAAILAALAFTQSATAATTITLGQVTPGGITTNPATAERIVEQQLEVNPNYRASIAQDIGATANQVEDALETTQARGIQRVTLGEKTCLNTGVVVSTGMIRTIGNDHRTVIVMKFRISIEGKWKTFKIKVDCGNPCKSKRQNHAPRAKVIQRTIELPFSKKFSKKVTVCPDSNRPINITISGRVKGKVRAKLWAKLYGAATIRIKQGINAEVDLKVTAVCRDETPPAVCCAPVVIIIPPGPCCPPPPPPPSPPAKPACSYMVNPEHVYPGMSRWIDLSCNTATFNVSVDNAHEWRGFVNFYETSTLPEGKVKWRFKYTAANPWSGDLDSGNFTPVAEDGTKGVLVLVSIQTPVDDF